MIGAPDAPRSQTAEQMERRGRGRGRDQNEESVSHLLRSSAHPSTYALKKKGLKKWKRKKLTKPSAQDKCHAEARV